MTFNSTLGETHRCVVNGYCESSWRIDEYKDVCCEMDTATEMWPRPPVERFPGENSLRGNVVGNGALRDVLDAIFKRLENAGI